MGAEFTHGYTTSQYPQVIYSRVKSANHLFMSTEQKIQKARQLWLERIIQTKCGGSRDKFFQETGIATSSISRMLADPGKKGAKNIGEGTIRTILGAFDDSIGLPEDGISEALVPQQVNPARHGELRDAALDMTIASMVYAMSVCVPGSAPVFAAHLKESARQAKPRPMRIDKGVIDLALGTAEPTVVEWEGNVLPLLQRESRKSKKQ